MVRGMERFLKIGARNSRCELHAGERLKGYKLRKVMSENEILPCVALRSMSNLSIICVVNY